MKNKHQKEGAKAFSDGLNIIDNPYYNGSYASKEWKQGYMDKQRIQGLRDLIGNDPSWRSYTSL